ncbi:MAG: HD domain-containing protein [Porphyromonadaceae bacterium]|nr:HD domain-containing protein [Porphyromonadaceae bacterium]
MIDPIEIIQRYYSPSSQAYRILVAHSQDVCQMATEIVQAHPELEADLQFVQEAAMLHDIGIYLTDASGIDCHGDEPYIRHGYLGAELLRSLGYPRHAHVAERHTGSGLTMQEIRQRGIDLPEGVYAPQSVEERIVCYADKFFSKTKLGKRKSLEAARRSLLKHGQEAVTRFDALHRELGLGTEASQ